MQEERYVLACYRYIELNPVRAGMVRHPLDYPWSSYGGNGDGKPNTLITPHFQYLSLSVSSAERLNKYRELFDAALDEQEANAIRAATNGNFVLGNSHFQREIELVLGRRTQSGRPGRPRSKPA